MIYGPLTITDILKMMWFGLTHPSEFKEVFPPLPQSARSVFDIKAETDKMPKPLIVVSTHDHSYREVSLMPTTAIRCVSKGRKVTLHEDFYPNEPPGKGFNDEPGMVLTRVNVLLAE